MNPETEAILKAMGFVPGEGLDRPPWGGASFFVPSTHFHICLPPKATPADLMRAIWEAGADAKKQEISQAREAYLRSMI